MSNNTARSHRGGFTLIEVAIATVVVAIGVVALMVGIGSSTRVNSSGRILSQAVLLGQDIREWSIKLPFFDPELASPGPLGFEAGETDVDDVDDLNGQALSPPRDGEGNAVSNMDDWTQTVTVQWMDPSDVAATSPTATDVVSVTTTIQHQGVTIFAASWLKTRSE